MGSTTDDVDNRIGCECVWLSEWVVLRMTGIIGLVVSVFDYVCLNE